MKVYYTDKGEDGSLVEILMKYKYYLLRQFILMTWACLLLYEFYFKCYKTAVEKDFSCRPLGSSGSSSGSGWWSGKKKRGKRHDYHLHHAGVVVTINRYVLGKNRWLIHKGNDYGDSTDTVITDADYMSSE